MNQLGIHRGSTPHCTGAYELVHVSSTLRLIGVATDLAHTKQQHTRKLYLGLHENLALQRAYQEDSNLDFISYPTPTRELAEQLQRQMQAEHEPSGRLFAPAVQYVQDTPSPPSHYNA